MRLKIIVLVIVFFTILTGCSWLTKPFAYTAEANTPVHLFTPIITETALATPTLLAEVTSLPPLSANSAKEVISSFVRNNGGCTLPCLMGLTPKENANSLVSFAEYFTNNTRQSNNQINGIDIMGHLDDDSGGALLTFWEDSIRVQIGIGAHKTSDKNQIENVTLSASVYEHFKDDNGFPVVKLLRQHSYYDRLLGSFSLKNILAKYGKPSEIWIYPFPEDSGYSYKTSTYPFDFVLVYAESRFAIEYISIVTDEGQYLAGCPDVSYIQVATWNRELRKDIDITEIALFFLGLTAFLYQMPLFLNHFRMQPILLQKSFTKFIKATTQLAA